MSTLYKLKSLYGERRSIFSQIKNEDKGGGEGGILGWDIDGWDLMCNCKNDIEIIEV